MCYFTMAYTLIREESMYKQYKFTTEYYYHILGCNLRPTYQHLLFNPLIAMTDLLEFADLPSHCDVRLIIIW